MGLSLAMSDLTQDVVRSGLPALDALLQGLRAGDNVVWQVDGLEDYGYFAAALIEQGRAEGRDCVYLRFGAHPAVLEPAQGLATIQLDPSAGFDRFSGDVHRIIEERGRGVLYVFDNLSSLVKEWATDEQLANFFQVTCPYLAELDTVTYFALMRGQHDYGAIARIRDTTQVLLDLYRADGQMYIHPLKVWDRYSPHMFLPHLVSGGSWRPVSQSLEAAVVSTTARGHPLGREVSSTAPWDSVYGKLLEYRSARPDLPETAPEVSALKQELAQMMLGVHTEFSRLADAYLTLDDLLGIRARLIGSGRIGGKAAGMLLARRILVADEGETDFSQVLEPHDSFFVGSDVFFTFLVHNDLFRLRLQLSRACQISWQEFHDVERRFLAGRFPSDIIAQFRDMLDHFGQAPIIVRSSSFLEDSFGNSFAGKYRSEFCPNQGGPEVRLDAFLRAVKLVYASALNPDVLSYRHRRGLQESDEQMAILVQRVSGMPYKKYFFPSLAGVAFSRNLYAWSDRIDPKQGIIRLVFGLGTRAVNRVGGDYPRMIAVSHPELRPESGWRIAKYSQHQADVLDLEANRLVSCPIAALLQECEYPNLHLLASVMADGHLYDSVTRWVDAPADRLVLTFNRLLGETPFVKIIGELVEKLERAYQHPVDTEFTAFAKPNGEVKVNVLQCRPLWLPGSSGPITVPGDVPGTRVLFRAGRLISGGVVRHIRYIVYVDPRRYASMRSAASKRSIGRVVGRVNGHAAVQAKEVLMMGPGRWGTTNIELGVNVGYADIDKAAALVELACEDAGHVPEVSYGTHFFLDLVEAQIIYLPVYPDDAAAQFNRPFFDESPNALPELLPGDREYQDVVKVIDVPRAVNGAYAEVIADTHSQRAVCLLA